MPALLVQVLLWAGATLLRQFLVSLGIGLASFAFILPLVNGIISTITSSFSHVAVEVLQIVELAGLSESMSILLGALITRATMTAMRKTVISRGGGRSLSEAL